MQKCSLHCPVLSESFLFQYDIHYLLDIPVLDLYQIEEDSEEWNTRITAYVEALEKKVPELENIHNTKHKGNVAVDLQSGNLCYKSAGL